MAWLLGLNIYRSMSRGFHEHFLGTDLFFPQGTQTPETKRPPKRPALVVPYLEKKRRRKKRTKKGNPTDIPFCSLSGTKRKSVHFVTFFVCFQYFLAK